MVIKQLNTRDDNHYFYKDLVNLKYFNPNLIALKRNKLANSDFIYCVGYPEKYPLRLYIRELDGYFSEEKHEGWSNKYLSIVLTDNVVGYVNVWKAIGDKISGGCEYEYDKDFMKVMINTDDDLPLNKVMRFHTLVFNIRHVFKKGNQYSP